MRERRDKKQKYTTDVPDIIAVGDVHAREDQPKCRIDRLWETQLLKYHWLYNLWEYYDYKPTIIQSGDIFERWKSSPKVISAVLEELPPMVTIPGNPGQHGTNFQQFKDDALYTVKVADRGWTVLDDPGKYYEDPRGHFVIVPMLWGEAEIPKPPITKKKKILLTHRNLFYGYSAFGGENAWDFLSAATTHGYELVISGHNHTPFVCNSKDATLINPGSFVRQTADEIHNPAVYFYWLNTKLTSIEQLPIDPGALSREHIDVEKEKNERLSAFIQLLDSGPEFELTIKFKANVRSFLNSNWNTLRDGVRERLMESIEEVQGKQE